jgi:uncharacterized repeat protein (TIGR02543 family)
MGVILVISLMAVFSVGTRTQPVNVVAPVVKDAVNKGQVTMDKDYGKMPLSFIPNKGQMDQQVYFYLQGKDKSVYFTSTGLTYALAGPAENQRGTESKSKPGFPVGQKEQGEQRERELSQPSSRWVVKLDFVNARKNVKPECLEKSGTVISYFKGKAEEWQTGLQAASKIIYRDLWPGIDLVYYGTVNKMKYEFIVHPGADPAQIKLAYRGADSVKENRQGQLEVQTPVGGFSDDTPMAWQEIAGKRETVSLKYALEKKDPSNPQEACIYGFSVGKYDKNEALILDPAVIVYCGYIGGSGQDCGYAIAVDASGCAYVTGITTSTETTFPVTVGPDLTYNGGSYYGDTFVAKIEADGSGLVYCGYIGGLRDEAGTKIAVDGSGCAYVTGYTCSDQTTFPVTVGPDLVFNGALGDSDAYVAKIKADGTALDYCGYIGGSGWDYGQGIAVDGSGCAYITGHTHSDQSTFPVTVGPDLIYNGSQDAFVAKVRADGTGLDYCGYIGGSSYDIGFGISVDGSGYAYISGFTSSTETSFPVTIGPDLTYNGGGYGGNDDAFVAKVKADGTGLVYCGYIGGLGEEHGFNIAVDGSGCAYVTGDTQADQTTFPVTAGPDLIHNGGTDAFVAKVRTDGTGLVYCGYIGGYNTDSGNGIAVDGSGCAYVTGRTYSTETTFPVAVGPDLTHNGGTYDAFVTKVKADGAGLDYCGYIGGSLDDVGNGIALDGSGCVYIAGAAQSTEATFPVTVGPDLTNNGGTYDTFVAKISSDTGYTVNFAARNGGALTGITTQTVDHGGNCSAVEAVPDSLYQFVNWTGTGGFVTTTDNPLTVTNVTANMTITANFTIDTYTVAFVPGSNGTLTGVTPQTVDYGTNCTEVEAVPNTGYHFVDWTGTNGFVTTTDNPLTVSNVTADMTITANFTIDTYTVTFVPGSHGTLTGVTPQSVNYGTNCTAVEAVPNTGYQFVNWTGTNGFVTTTDNPLAVANVTGDMTITANFALNPPLPIQLGAWSTTTPFNTPRQAHTSVVYNGYLYVLGGFDGTGAIHYNDVQYAPINADGSLGTWQVATPFNTGRRGHTSVAYNGYLYVMGGTALASALNDVQFAPINADGSLGSWQYTTPFNPGRFVFSSVVYNGYLYVIQGFYYSAASPLTDVQVAAIDADGTLGPWQSTTTFAPGRWGHQSIAYNQYLYTMGGWNWNGSYYTLGDVQYSSINANGTLNAWQGTTALAPDRGGFGLVQYGGNLIMTGGINNSGYYHYVQYAMTHADGTLGPWLRMTSFNKARCNHTSVVHNGYLYVIGGADNTGTAFADVQYAKINEQSPPTHAVTFVESTGGTINGSHYQVITDGEDCAQVTAVPDTGYGFVNWTGTGGFVTTTDNPLTVTNVTADMTVTANFTIDTHTVTFAPGSNGTLTGVTLQTVDYGTNCTAVEAVPNTGYHFVNWTGTNGFVTTTGNPLTVSNVTADMTITANFTIDTYTVTFVPDSNGTLTGDTPQSVNYGNNCTAVGAVPNSGYQFVNWTGTNGFVTTTANPLTVANVTGDMTVTANFAFDSPLPIQLGAWSTTTPFNTPRQAHTSVVYNGYLYVLGGFDGTDTIHYNDVQYAPINADGSLGTWQAATPFNTGRRGHTSVAYNGYLYVMGGTTLASALNDVQFAPINADGSLGSWQYTTPFNTGRFVFSSVVYNGYLYVIQGFYYSAASPLTDVQVAAIDADGTLGPWQNTTNFTPGRWGHQSIAYNQYLYTMGGYNWSGSYYTLGDVQYSSIAADGTLNAWQGTTALDPARGAFGLVQYGGNLIMTGGDYNFGYYHYVQYAATHVDGTLGPWLRMTSFNKARSNHTSVVHNGYLYVIGGSDNTGTIFSDVQYAKINEQSQLTHAVTFVESAGGTISGSLYQVITDGEDCAQVTAVPGTGCQFVNWTGDGGFVTTTDNPLTVSNVTADMTITANFAIDTYTVTFVPGSNGTLTGDTPQSVNYGNNCTAVEAVPNTGYHFIDWTGTNGFVTTTDNPLTVTNVTANMTITANFTIDTYTVTFVPGSNGTLTGVTPQAVNYGNNCSAVEAVPNTGYQFFNWTGTNGFVTTTANPLTVSNVTADMTITANFLYTNLTGRVTDSGNNGIANLNVNVYDLNQTFVKSGTTNSNGDYVVPDLTAGSYKVFFDGASAGNYLSEWYDDKGAFEAADVLTLDIVHPLQGIDAQLNDGGIISGRVTDYAGTGLEHVDVNLYDLNQEFVVSVSTDANGDYAFYNIPAGDYKLYSDAGAAGNYVSEWYQNTLSFDEAETLTVTAEVPLEHIDVGLSAGGIIAGHITNETGQGIQGVRVVIRDRQNTWIAAVDSDGSGNYSISRLVPDSYKVLFKTDNAVGLYVKEWYNDKEYFNTADLLVVPAGETTTLDVVLTAGGAVSGTVTNGTDPIENMEVDIYRLDSSYIASGYTDSSGNYLVKGIPVGTYKVIFNPWELNYHGVDWYGMPRNYNYQYQWYDQKDSFAEADEVPVTVGNTTSGIDAVMNENGGGIISGRITDSSGSGIAGGSVCVFESYDNLLDWYYSEYYTGTGPDGNYEIKGLPTGNYIVLFCSQDSLYKREFYDNTRDRDLAARVPVTAGQTTPGIDAVLEKAGVITGCVTDSKGIGLANVMIRVMDAATNKYLSLIGNSAQTDEEGEYEVRVHPGQWKVMFQAYMMNVSGYVSEFYNNRTTVEDANIVTAAAEEPTPNIDAVLSYGGGKISGYVKDTVNTGLSNAQVYVNDTQYKVFVGNDTADSSGYFEVAGLIPGNYKVYTFYYDVYPPEWYSDETAYETAKTLTVTTGGNTYIEVVLGGDDPVNPGALRVTSPNGGESLTGGTIYQITWTSIGSESGENVIIEYSLDDGVTWIMITSAAADTGSYSWTVPAVNSGTCRVKITSGDGDAGISDASDEPFGIVSTLPPSIRLMSPKRWISITAGTVQVITWTSTGNVSQVVIEYSTDSAITWSTIAASAPNTGSYQWAVPDTPSQHCHLRIFLGDGDSESAPFDMTDTEFSIVTTTTPSLTIISPNGGESWRVGTAHTITWVKTGNVPNVKIEYTINGGSSWLVITTTTPNTGSYPWTVPGSPSGQCKVRVSDIDGNPTDMSNAVFSIEPLPTITLTSPNGGETWEAGTVQDITWTWDGTGGDVKIEYSIEGGTGWSVVTSSADNSGIYSWTVPDTPSGNCLVRIGRDDTEEGPTDISDGVFTIEAAPLLALQAPNGGEQWKAGETYRVSWTASNLEGNVVIDLYRGDDFDFNIGTASVNDDRLEWKIPENFKNADDYRVVIHKNLTEDSSDTAFSITERKPNDPDFDNDGKVDIIWWNRATGKNEVWFMDGTRRKAIGILPPEPGKDFQLVGTGDFNRDGKVDILWRRSADDQNLVWYMDGIRQKGTVVLPAGPGKNWQVVGTGDFNGDGQVDILWRQVLNGRGQVWLMNGVTLAGQVELPAGENLAWRMVGTEDFNDDDKVDILWRDVRDGRNEVWFMDGVVRTGTMAVQEQTKLQWQIVGTGDFNCDGHVDILWRRSSDGKNLVWYMDGVVRIGYEYININPGTSGSDTSDLN